MTRLGGGVLAPPVNIPQSLYVGQFVGADVNGDGKDDVALAYGALGVAVFLSLGNGSFTAPTFYSAAPHFIEKLTAADINGDGAVDLVLGGSKVRGTAVLLNQGAGTFGTVQLYPGGNASYQIAAAAPCAPSSAPP